MLSRGLHAWRPLVEATFRVRRLDGAAATRGWWLGGVRGAQSGSSINDTLFLKEDFEEEYAQRVWRIIRGAKVDAGAGNGDAAGKAASEGSNELVASTPESRHRRVLALPLVRRPLIPGVMMQVPVTCPTLAAKLKELTAPMGVQAYVAAFLQRDEDDQPLMDDDDGVEEVVLEDQAGVGAVVDAKSRATSTRAYDTTDPARLLHKVGTFAQVRHFQEASVTDDKKAFVLLYGHRRLRRLRTVKETPLMVEVEYLKDHPYDADDDNFKATTMEVVSTIQDLVRQNPLYQEHLKHFVNSGGDYNNASWLADLGATLTSAPADKLQSVLTELNVPARSEAVLLLLKQELDLLRLQAKIRERVEENISGEQRKHFLREQLRSIKKELGMEKDDKRALIDGFQASFDKLRAAAPAEVVKVVDEELAKLEMLEPASSEFNVTRNYLDWLTCIPFGLYDEERYNLEQAQETLDAAHYGMQDVKERILEFIAVAKLRGSSQGKILCLVGPPGVGKTSIARSIAEALNRKYYRFSVGGLSDVAEIKGHRRTYVGAMPGKLVQALKKVGSSNPLVLIDEVDKLGYGSKGDPASALLELLDPEQNTGFVDHYLDVPLDLSKVLFMCTANVLQTIPDPLRDRMEVIELAGYISGEKVHISRNHLLPKVMREAGVPEGAARLTEDALHALIDQYCREPGVRALQQHLEKLYRKLALRLVRDGARREEVPEEEVEMEADATLERSDAHATTLLSSTATAPTTAPSTVAPKAAADSGRVVYDGEQLVVDTPQLVEYLGHPKYPKTMPYEVLPPGVVAGLAYTGMGGRCVGMFPISLVTVNGPERILRGANAEDLLIVLYIELQRIPSSGDSEGTTTGQIKVTGSLGSVMRESSTIAQSFARAFLREVADERNLSDASRGFFDANWLHLHFPEGGVQKDGPSAGIAIVTAMLSLAMDRPVSQRLAMTGEVSLTGRVLPIGGVKEKTMGAKRSGIDTLIFPEENRRDWVELSDEVRAGITVHFAKSYADVFRVAFPEDEAEVAPVVQAPDVFGRCVSRWQHFWDKD